MSEGIAPRGQGVTWGIIVGGLVLAAALAILGRDPSTIRALDTVKAEDLAGAPDKVAAVLLDKGMDIHGVTSTANGQSMVVSHFARYFRCDLAVTPDGQTSMRCFPIKAAPPG